ncbi:hypothetical protein K438DRAFT_1557680 [Mycena galopus ATCC 62051]|nr:hypothetical protein K438DRAFT_1557680 [Mycena galopus ATCC 62051]
MDSLQTKPLKAGLVNLPGATPASTALVAKLLHKDVTEHHCFFNDQFFHNHLSHHILSLHDLGAPAECIQKMYDIDAAMQRPLHHHGGPAEANRITKENWTSHLGEKHAHMYPDYLAFFASEISKNGVPDVLERYIFSPEANGNGTLMLGRFVGGLLHPMIEAGFGIEFDQDALVAEGLAQAALTTPESAVVLDMPAGVPEIKSGPSTSLLSLLREVYDSPKIAPLPYDKERITPEKLNTWIASNPDLGPTIRDIYSKWTFNLTDEKDIEKKVEECMWQAALLLGATSKPGRKPRMDFFLMHLLTGTLLLRVVLDAVKQPLHKAQLLQVYVRVAALFVVLRGRPQIDPSLVMSYPACPVPPKNATTAASGTLSYGSPWLALLNNAAVHTEPHVVKSIRMLFYCAQHYGNTPSGAVVGAIDANGKETHAGAAVVDGTLFIRVAGVLTGSLGWVAHGEEERGWDFRGVGWEEAWNENDD